MESHHPQTDTDTESNNRPRTTGTDTINDLQLLYSGWSLTEGVSDEDDGEKSEESLRIKYGGFDKKSFLAWVSGDSQNSDDDYDTDLEDGFPEIKDASITSLDPTGALYYTDMCNRQGVRPVSFLLRHMSRRHLRMRHHYMKPEETKLYTQALQRNRVTETLDLADNHLGEEGVHHCCDLLKDNMFLSNLDLSMNFIGREGIESISAMLEYNSTLTTLALSGNGLTDSYVKILADALRHNSSITCLNLSHNKIYDLGGIYLAAGLARNTSVQDLDLSWNGIREKGAAAIINLLKTNKVLEILDLSWNGLSNVGSDALSQVLKVNKTLKVLDISNNRIGATAAEKIAVGMKGNTGLESLWVDMNPCGSAGIAALLKSLNSNTSLRLFSIEDITLDADICKKIAELQNDQERDLTIIHNGMGGHGRSVAHLSLMSSFVKYLNEFSSDLEFVFNQLDVDKSGDISVDELKIGLKTHGLRLTNRQIDILMEALDINRNATIEYKELLQGDLIARSKEICRKRITAAQIPTPETLKQETFPAPPESRDKSKVKFLK